MLRVHEGSGTSRLIMEVEKGQEVGVRDDYNDAKSSAVGRVEGDTKVPFIYACAVSSDGAKSARRVEVVSVLSLATFLRVTILKISIIKYFSVQKKKRPLSRLCRVILLLSVTSKANKSLTSYHVVVTVTWCRAVK